MNATENGSDIFVGGIGAVSPAGWGVPALCQAMDQGLPLPTKEILRPAQPRPLRVRQVPAPASRPSWLANPRLRRTSPITQYGVAAAFEALGDEAARVADGSLRLGIIVCVMSGCVNYSRRFYDETLRDPATASPLVFPETVFNAPASHLAAVLGTNAINYTLVGDPGTFLQGLALAADWLGGGTVDGCLVVGAEETDWITSHAFDLFNPKTILGDGAGAVYLRRTRGGPSAVRLMAISDAHLFTPTQPRLAAAARMRGEFSAMSGEAVLVDGVQRVPSTDWAETRAWQNWSQRRISPKIILGEGLMAASAWQTVLAIEAVQRGAASALVSVVGTNQQAIGAAFGPAS